MDKAKGIYTLPVILGEKNARYFAIVLMALQYLFVSLTFSNISYFFKKIWIHTRYLIVFLKWGIAPQSLVIFGLYYWFKLVKVYTVPAPKKAPADYPKGIWPLWFVAHGNFFNFLFKFLFFIVNFFLHIFTPFPFVLNHFFLYSF